uniref:Uncharacterized protein n=1 Tax=Bos mutus grunniens TaxID=30521 RepID=A0A8B9WQJ8_BOSMU
MLTYDRLKFYVKLSTVLLGTELFLWGFGLTLHLTFYIVPGNSSQTTSPAPHPANATTKASDGTLQSTASLFVISVSLLHLYC